MMKIVRIIILLLIYGGVNAQNSNTGKDIIGKGYDIFDEYARNSSMTNYKLFDYNKLNKYINLLNISKHEIKKITGTSKREYAENLAAKLNIKANALIFKASVDAQFGRESTKYEQRYCHTIMDANIKWKVILDIRNIDSLIACLDVQFKSDIENLSPQKLFETYGTHFISSAYLGGRIDFSLRTSISNQYNKQDIDIAAKARYGTIKGNGSYTNNSEEIINNSKTSIETRTIGGNSEFLNNINNEQQYRIWAEGIKNAPVLCDFEKESLQPIWILTKNTARQNELKKYFENFIIPAHPLPDFVEYQSLTEVTYDEVLDMKKTDVRINYDIYILGFYIIADCDDGVFTDTDEGEFEYTVYINNTPIAYTKQGFYKSANNGQYITIKKTESYWDYYNEETTVKVSAKISEWDEISADEQLGNKYIEHNLFKYSEDDLYNYTDNSGTKWFKIKFYYSDICKAEFYYQIIPKQYKVAFDFGNKGWESFENSNYKEALEFSKKALKLDNTLWYVHFNVALVYLVEANPKAHDKYVFTLSLANSIEDIRGGYNDIIDYEKKHGKIPGSDNIKELFEKYLK